MKNKLFQIFLILIMSLVSMISFSTLYKVLRNRKTFPIKERSALLTFLYGFSLTLSILLISSG